MYLIFYFFMKVSYLIQVLKKVYAREFWQWGVKKDQLVKDGCI